MKTNPFNPLDFNHDGKVQYMEYKFAKGDYSGGEAYSKHGCGAMAALYFGVAFAIIGVIELCTGFSGDLGFAVGGIVCLCVAGALVGKVLLDDAKKEKERQEVVKIVDAMIDDAISFDPAPAKQAPLAEPAKAPEPKTEPNTTTKSNAGFIAGLVIVATLVIALIIAVCAAAGKSNMPTNTANANAAKPAATTTKPATNTNTQSAEEIDAKKAVLDEMAAAQREQKLQYLAQMLPYAGMEEEFIDNTWLGPHENAVAENIASGQYRGQATSYRWYSRNGKHDMVFSALVKDGAIIKVNKGLSSTDYWPTVHGLPDLYASGTPRKKITSPTKPDPADYDDPEDYADDLRDYQRATGDKSTRYDDPYDDYELNR